jgi:glyoxylase-like metal-dependent hydrolase (beta-lactamase superfamily II)
MRSLALKGRPRRLHPLRFGWEPITESVSLRGGSPDRYLLEPVTGAAVVFDEGWVLVDTGFNIDTIRDDAKRLSHYVIPCYTALVPQGDPLVDQITGLGLTWQGLAACVVSHLHCDHSGGLRHLVDGPPIVIQRAELEFGMSESTLHDAYFRSDFDMPGLNWELAEGDEELADGLRLLPTPGHTPGHTSVVVELENSGSVVLACDAADLRANVEQRIAPGTTTSPDLEEAAQSSIDRLHDLDAQEGTEVWPGHDLAFWNTRVAFPGAYT